MARLAKKGFTNLRIRHFGILYDGSQVQCSSSRKPSYLTKYRSQGLFLGPTVVLLWSLSWRRSSPFLEAFQGYLFDTKDRICAFRPWASCRHILDGIGVNNRVQEVAYLDRPLGWHRELTSASTAKGLWCLPEASNVWQPNLVMRILTMTDVQLNHPIPE